MVINKKKHKLYVILSIYVLGKTSPPFSTSPCLNWAYVLKLQNLPGRRLRPGAFCSAQRWVFPLDIDRQLVWIASWSSHFIRPFESDKAITTPAVGLSAADSFIIHLSTVLTPVTSSPLWTLKLMKALKVNQKQTKWHKFWYIKKMEGKLQR